MRRERGAVVVVGRRWQQGRNGRGGKARRGWQVRCFQRGSW